MCTVGGDHFSREIKARKLRIRISNLEIKDKCRNDFLALGERDKTENS
jgi:hypothetical protein